MSWTRRHHEMLRVGVQRRKHWRFVGPRALQCHLRSILLVALFIITLAVFGAIIALLAARSPVSLILVSSAQLSTYEYVPDTTGKVFVMAFDVWTGCCSSYWLRMLRTKQTCIGWCRSAAGEWLECMRLPTTFGSNEPVPSLSVSALSVMTTC